MHLRNMGRGVAHFALQPSRLYMKLRLLSVVLLSLAISACGATAKQVVPTARPTATQTLTPTVTPTPGIGATPTVTPRSVASGPTPTPLFGPTTTPQAALTTATRPPNPNAPRIEFFTTNVQQ